MYRQFSSNYSKGQWRLQDPVVAALTGVPDRAQPWAPGSAAHACPEGVSEFED